MPATKTATKSATKTEKKAPRKPLTWEVVKSPLPKALGKRLTAFTKGEARAELRRKLGVPRLPSGIVLEKVG